jgi:hypothetical protein
MTRGRVLRMRHDLAGLNKAMSCRETEASSLVPRAEGKEARDNGYCEYGS